MYPLRRKNKTLFMTTSILFLVAILYYHLIYVQLSVIGDPLPPHNPDNNPDNISSDAYDQMLRGIIQHMDKNEELDKVAELLLPKIRNKKAVRKLIFTDKCSVIRNVDHNRATIQLTSLVETLDFRIGHGGKTRSIFPNLAALPFNHHLRILLVPHSHCDPGWLDTYTSYYMKQVRHLLTNLYEFARDHTEFRYVYAEVSFFKLWWEEQNEEVREGMRRLVEEGRFEFLQGGWVQADEANTHYFALFNEMLDGHDWLKENLPEAVPKSGWAIDPFGLSPMMGYVNKLFGLTGMHIDRVHYRVKTHLATKKNIEFHWRQSWDATGETDILTHLNPFPGYNTENTCGPDRNICEKFTFYARNNKKVKVLDSNVKELSTLILSQWRKKAALHQTDTIFVELGDDFTYTKKEYVSDIYNNYTPIMNYINNEANLNTEVKWGTVTEYFDHVRAHGVEKIPSLSGDFFTYADTEADYWSGYFTSRPFYKNLDRILESALRRTEILFSFTRLTSSIEDLVAARHALSLFQHHDGITGTSVRKVVDDYGAILYDAYKSCNEITAQAIKHLLNHDNVFSSVVRRPVFNDYDRYEVLGGFQELILVNTLPRDINTVKLVAVQSGVSVGVVKEDGTIVEQQVEPRIEYGNVILDSNYIVFQASVPSVSLQTCRMESVTQPSGVAKVGLYNTDEAMAEKLERNFETKEHDSEKCSNIVLGSEEGLRITIDCQSGRLTAMERGTIAMSVDQEILLYTGNSGAYIFRPQANPKKHLTSSSRPKITVVKGPVRHKAIVYISDMLVLSYTVNLLVERDYVELEVLTDLKENGDLVVRFKTDIFNRGSLFTDNNGHTIQQHRFKEKLQTQGNFFPMPSTAFIQDSSRRFTLLSSEPHGVASLENGYIEVVLDRRYTSTNDHRGLPEGIKDNLPTPARFRMLVESHQVAELSEGYTVEYPSLLSYQVLQTLQHPVFVGHKASGEKDHESDSVGINVNDVADGIAADNIDLVEEVERNKEEPGASKLTSRQLMKELPCDEELVNLRYVDVKTSLMIRRRLGFTCSIVYPDMCMDRRSPDLSDVFVDNISSKEHPFSPFHNTTTKSYPLKPMQFTSDYITFNDS